MEDLVFTTLAAVDVAGWIEKVTNVLAVVLGLGLVIFFHELGHFAVAKWCNVHVERFSIGIGPILWSRQKGETEYALSALPFGGYVKMLGQDDMDPNQMTSSEIAENPRSYSAKSAPQRMAIISAGVTMNVITGYLFYVICYWFGVFETAPTIGIVRVGSPAWEVGMASGDRITSINGEPIRSFMDVQEAIMLSSGDISVSGVHADETEFTYTVTPAKLGPGRSIGVGPATLCELVNRIPEPDLISETGMPLEKATEKFQQSDRIVAVRVNPPKPTAPTSPVAGEAPATEDAGSPASPPAETASNTPAEPIPVSMLFQLRQVLGRYADRELTYIVERRDSEDPDAAAKTVEITIPPQQVRSVGFWMAMGPVRAIQNGSVAEVAGLKLGDEIRKVDGLVPGTDLDPLALPTYFAKKAGQQVTLNVERTTNDGPQNEVITLVPTDKPGWTEPVDHKTAPLSIPSLGMGFQVQTRIAKVFENSEAGKLGILVPGTTKITKIELIHKAPVKGQPDALGDLETPYAVDLSTISKKEIGTPEEINWAWAFEHIQRVPDRKILIHFENGKETGSRTLETTEHVPDWYIWFRGFSPSIWMEQRDLQKATTFGEAFTMAATKTRRTALSIYRSLKQMVRGDVAMESLSGPLGIAKIGYLVAERGVIDLLMFLAFLSINLAILNFLPIPVLDGGHMVFLIWECVTRRKPSARVIGWAHAVGFLFLISLFAFVMWIDLFVSEIGK